MVDDVDELDDEGTLDDVDGLDVDGLDDGGTLDEVDGLEVGAAGPGDGRGRDGFGFGFEVVRDGACVVTGVGCWSVGLARGGGGDASAASSAPAEPPVAAVGADSIGGVVVDTGTVVRPGRRARRVRERVASVVVDERSVVVGDIPSTARGEETRIVAGPAASAGSGSGGSTTTRADSRATSGTVPGAVSTDVPEPRVSSAPDGAATTKTPSPTAQTMLTAAAVFQLPVAGGEAMNFLGRARTARTSPISSRSCHGTAGDARAGNAPGRTAAPPRALPFAA